MRFPLRRHHDLPEEPRLREPVPFVPPAARVPEPPPPPDEPAAAEPESAPPPVIPAPQPLPRLALRGQFSGSDARAERLVRTIRGDVEELRDALDQMAHDRGELLQADIEAIVADPECGASLPAPVLVRALLVANKRNEALTAERDRARERARKLKSRLDGLRLEHSALSARAETLEDVIAALHANLEDLRAERDGQRRLAAPGAPQPIRPGASDALAPPRLIERE